MTEAPSRPVSSSLSEADWGKLGLHKAPEGYGPEKNLKSPENPKGRGRYIDVGDGHKIYAQEYGNPQGEPLIFLHGGPGGGGDDGRGRYYDLKRFRLIVFDQRGAGHSTPKMNEDYDAAMKNNNTAYLVDDIEKVRDAFDIKGKAHITGGSWGSTLALAYAIKHPEHVKSLILCSIFLGSKETAQALFQGNARQYKPVEKPLTNESTPEEIEAFMTHYNKQPASKEGSYRAYMGDGTKKGQIPKEFHQQNRHMAVAIAKAWDEFVRVIPSNERGDMTAAYTRILARDPNTLSEEEKTFQVRAAFAFSKWEGILGQFSFETNEKGEIDLGRFVDPKFALTFARTEATYMRDGFYLNKQGTPSKTGSKYLMDNLKIIAKEKIPMIIIHGKRDLVCRPDDAEQLRDGYKGAGGPVDFTMSEATSHLQKEKGTAQAHLALKGTERIPLFTHADWEAQPTDRASAIDQSRKGDRVRA